MSFHQLSDELVLNILGYIHALDIDKVVLLNRRVHNISHSCKWIEQRRAKKSNSRAMVALFGGPDLRPIVRMGSSRQCQVANLDYLDLREDLTWLTRHHESSEDEVDDPRRSRGVNSIIRSARRLGLTLPPSFVLFMRSVYPRNCVSNDPECPRFRLGKLYRYKEFSKDGPNGYLVRFQSALYGLYFWTLYLDDAGHHCVLGSQDDIGLEGARTWVGGGGGGGEGEEDEGEEGGGDKPGVEAEEENEMESWREKKQPQKEKDVVPISYRRVPSGDLKMQETSFESFLARGYFGQRIEWLPGPLEAGPQAYIDHISSRSRNTSLKR